MKAANGDANNSGGSTSDVSTMTTPNAESICDPEVAAALANLDETQIRDSIRNT